MTHRTKLNMADTWSEGVEARLIAFWLTFPLLYDVADKHYLNYVLKENALLEIGQVTNMTGSVCVQLTIDLPNLKLLDASRRIILVLQ